MQQALRAAWMCVVLLCLAPSLSHWPSSGSVLHKAASVCCLLSHTECAPLIHAVLRFVHPKLVQAVMTLALCCPFSSLSLHQDVSHAVLQRGLSYPLPDAMGFKLQEKKKTNSQVQSLTSCMRMFFVNLRPVRCVLVCAMCYAHIAYQVTMFEQKRLPKNTQFKSS